MGKLFRWLGGLITGEGINSRPPSHMIPFIQEMKQKDPQLYDDIGHMLILEGILVWREKYPEDLTDLTAPIMTRGAVKL